MTTSTESLRLNTDDTPVPPVFPPLSDPGLIECFETTDADEQAQMLREWDQTYDQISVGRFSGKTTGVWFKDFQIFREVTNQSVHECGTAWSGSHTFGIPIAMSGNACFRSCVMGPDAMLSLGEHSELDFRTPQHLDIVGVSFKSDWIEDYVRTVEGWAVHRHLGGRDLIALRHDRMVALSGFMKSIFEMIDERPALLDYANARATLWQGILVNVFGAIDEADGDPQKIVGWRPYAAVVDRAKSYVLSHPFEAVTVAELCLKIGVSRRRLQYAFQEILDTSPIQYLRAIRLDRVRRELKKVSDDTTGVQDVAARWGFWHLGHFSTDYKRMFGESPSATLRAGRARRKGFAPGIKS